MLEIPPTTLTDLDLETAADEEIRRPRLLLPRQALEYALENHISEVAEYLKGLYSRGLELLGADEIQATKSGHSLRPLAILSLSERVLYEALASKIASYLPPISREYRDWEAFAKAPLAETGTRYVVSADIASFYHYVDHELLESELVAQTGDAALANTMSAFLHGVMQRQFGLPQLYRASDILSDLVIDIVERRLIRQGWVVWRFNDDFRLAVKSWRAAQGAIEALDREARAIGLSLNDEKTFPQRTATYSRWIAAPDAAWDKINDTVEFDFRAYSPYGSEEGGTAEEDEEEEEEEEDPTLVEAAALRALEYWSDLPSRGTKEGVPVQVYRRLLRQALTALTQIGSPEGLPTVRNILAREPQFAPFVSRYLSSAATGDPVAVMETFEGLSSDRLLYLNSWQRLWLMESIPTLSRVSPSITKWMKNCLVSTKPGILRARAALVLAWVGAIKPNEIVRVFEQLPEASRPDAVAALATLVGESDPRVRAMASDSPISRWVVDWATRAG